MKKITPAQLPSITAALIGFAGLIIVLLLDHFFWRLGLSPLHEGVPISSPNYLFRSGIIFISVFSIYWAFVDYFRPRTGLTHDLEIIELVSIVATLIILIMLLFLFLVKPELFNILSVEDGFIEWASAILLFCCSSIFLVSCFSPHSISHLPTHTRWTSFMFAVVFFVIGMEEVSWFQRVLKIETPIPFSSNNQGELNFHNFATDKIENIYYQGTYIFLVVLPFFRWLNDVQAWNRYLLLFTPRPFIAFIGAGSCAYNFDMWNNIHVQAMFFFSILIFYSFITKTCSRIEKTLALVTICLLIITQTSFLIFGENFAYLWEITEFKEFLIPLGFFVYTTDVIRKMKSAYPIPAN